MGTRSSLPVDLDLSVEGGLTDAVEAAAYYVCAEAVTNAVKHAQASQACGVLCSGSITQGQLTCLEARSCTELATASSLDAICPAGSSNGGNAGSGGGGDIGGLVLLRLGAKFGPLILAGQWWRLVTAIFLHGGLLHIGMNLWCLFDLGPEVESLFSTPKFIVLYLATGVFGFVLSMFWSPRGLSIGASGAVLGLIGVLIGASYHHGTLGKDYRSRLWRWVIYILIFGLLPIFAVDNAAHIGGLLSGLALGYFIPEGDPETRASETLWNALALVSVLIIAGSFAMMALQLNAKY